MPPILIIIYFFLVLLKRNKICLANIILVLDIFVPSVWLLPPKTYSHFQSVGARVDPSEFILKKTYFNNNEYFFFVTEKNPMDQRVLIL